MKISDETKIGIFAVFTLTVLILGFNILKGRDVFSSSHTYYAYYDNINGLQVSNPIVLRGHRIGKVYDIEFDDENSDKVKVTLSITVPVELKEGTIAKIVDLDILGAKAVEIVPGKGKNPVESKGTLKGETAKGLGDAIDKTVKPIADKLNNTLAEFNRMLDEGASDNLKQSIENLKESTDDIRELTDKMRKNKVIERLSAILANVDAITKTIKSNQAEIDNFIKNINNISDSIKASDLAKTIDESYQLVNHVNLILEKVNKGEGSLGQLVNDDKLYVNLEKTSKNLNILIEDLKKHPSRYVNFSVFGKKDKGSKTETEEK